MLSQIKTTIKKYHMLSLGDRVILGVSGGPDSVALLIIMQQLKNEYGLYLHIGHLDHKIRKDSYQDRIFVQRLAEKFKIPITAEEINVLKLKKKGSLEEIARNARFEFLCNVAKRNQCNKIALGQTKDDQAETVLMRILRGTGLYGLQAIFPIRKIASYIVIRPLIEVERKDIEQFLKVKKVRYRIDTTNLSTRFFRNKIRHRLIPFLEKEFSPNIKYILSTMASHTSIDYAYLENLSKKALKNCCIIANVDKIELHIERFKKLNLAIQRMVLRLAINLAKGNMRRLTFKHLQEIEELINRRPADSIVNLPQDISIKKKKQSFIIRKD